MPQHPWEQIISEYYLSGLTKGKFFSQYKKAHPEEKICLSTFYNKLVFFEELLREATSAPTESEPCKIAESFSEPSVLDGDLVNIIEIEPETLAQEQSRSFIPLHLSQVNLILSSSELRAVFPSRCLPKKV